MLRWLRQTLIVAVIAVAGALALEALYRLYLWPDLERQLAARPRSEYHNTPGTFEFHAWPSRWRYDRRIGFHFNEIWRGGDVVQGTLVYCGDSPGGNRYGNIGPITSNYESADLKVLMVGSSFTMTMDSDGLLINNILERKLSEVLHKRVGVINYSRYSTGFLTYFDMIDAEMDRVTPDLIVQMIVTTSFGYRRMWWFLEPIRPGYWRVAVSLDPNVPPRNPNRSVIHPWIVSDEVTEDWCTRMNALPFDSPLRRDDSVVREMTEAQHLTLDDMARSQIGIDLWSLRRSFVLTTLRHGNPYAGQPIFKDEVNVGGVELTNYEDDPASMAAIARVKAKGIPMLIVHIPTRPEMEATGDFLYSAHGIEPARGRSLTASLERLTGRKIVRLWGYYDAALKAEPVALVTSRDDNHPSQKGMHAMSDALVRVIVEELRR